MGDHEFLYNYVDIVNRFQNKIQFATCGTFSIVILRSHFISAVSELDSVYNCVFIIYNAQLIKNVEFTKKYNMYIERVYS